jgi:hypothetical protein
VRKQERVIWTDVLDTQFPDAENKHDCKNVGVFVFQTPDGACSQSFFFLHLNFISFLMYIIKEQFISFSNNVYSFILETIIYKWISLQQKHDGNFLRKIIYVS